MSIEHSPARGSCAKILIVDDSEEMIRHLVKLSKGRFDGLFYTATTPKAAVKQLVQEQGTITHIVCDWDLGQAHPKGEALLSDWRRTFKGIERCVLWTGENLNGVELMTGIDAVVSKSESITKLFESLGV